MLIFGFWFLVVAEGVIARNVDRIARSHFDKWGKEG